MKNIIRRHFAIALVLILISSVCFLFSTRKEGMFIDEIYTYGLSNNSSGPYLRDIKGGSIEDAVFTREEFLDYVSITEGEGFDFVSVYRNQAGDVHPPLYYWLFNIASSLTPGVFSKWTGLALDYVIYMLAVIVLYMLVMKLGGSRENACAAAVLYGLSLIGLSTMLMIRMYVLLTLFTLLLAYFVACLLEEFRPRYCVYAGITLLLGMMTQYFFVFYAFFLCGLYVLYLLYKKQWQALKYFVPCALIGTLSVFLLFPPALSHLFSDKFVSGANTVGNLLNFAQYPARLSTFFIDARHGLKAVIFTLLAALILLLLLFKGLKKAWIEKRISLNWLIIIIPALVTFPLVAVIAAVDEPRYIYNLIPIFVLGVAFLLHLIEQSLPEKLNRAVVRNGALLCIAAFALWQARCAPPEFLFPQYAEYNAILSQHADAPCVYFTDEHFEPMTQDLLQLLIFEDVYVSDEGELDGMLSYLGDSDKAVIYVDISEFWSSGYDAEAILASIAADTDYTNSLPLYQNELSATYLIYK